MFFALIAIGSQYYGIFYSKIFKKDAHARIVKIMLFTFEKAISRLNLRSSALKYLNMINDLNSRIIRTPDELRKFQIELI